MTASASRQDGEFAVPAVPITNGKRVSSRSRPGQEDVSSKRTTKRVADRVAPPRTSLEDTIENLVECARLPLSSELLSSRAKADLAFHQRQSRTLRHSSSQQSFRDLNDSSEPLGPATPGVEAYKRPSSSGSSSSGFLYDYYNSDPHEEVSFHTNPDLSQLEHSGIHQTRRPSTSSQASDGSRSKIPIPTNGMSRSWSASEGLAVRPSRTNPEFIMPRSTSHGSANTNQLMMPPPRRSSIKRQNGSREEGPERQGKRQDQSPASARRGHDPQPTPQHTPVRKPSKRVNGSQSVPAQKSQVDNKGTPLGSKRVPIATSRPPRSQGVGASPQTRSRAVTGNAGARRPAAETLKQQTRPRPRSQSSAGFDSRPSDLSGPPASNDAPIIYRSDQITKSKTSDSLAALGREKRRGDEENARLDQAGTWDDVVIPTVAKQMHQQELLEQAIAKDEAERAQKAGAARKARDEDYQRATSQSPEKQTAVRRPLDPSEELLPTPPPISPTAQEKMAHQRRPSRLDSNARKEVWEMPGLESPKTAQKLLKGQQNEPPAQDEPKGGCCSSCTIC